jgi:uncharacterized protein (UPF0332 family)
MARPGQSWLGTDELSCNIREDGVVVYGPTEILTVERPVLQHARAALAKAERFADLSGETPDDRFEGVIHGAYYAMFHAARAALLAVEGSASTNHGRVVETFKQTTRRRRLQGGRDHAAALANAFELRMEADYGDEDLTEAGRQLRAGLPRFLDFCRTLVDRAEAKG